MLNTVILIGRLVRDPELRYTTSGAAVANFTLAVDRPFTNQQGQREADFIDIVTWRKLAETCGNHLGKGRLVAVEGRLQIRSYEPRMEPVAGWQRLWPTTSVSWIGLTATRAVESRTAPAQRHQARQKPAKTMS